MHIHICYQVKSRLLSETSPTALKARGIGIIFRCAFSCMLQCSLCHGMDIDTCDIVHCSAAPHDCIANRTVFLVYVVLVLNVIRYSCHYFLDRTLFHHDFHHDCCDCHWDFMAINYLFIYTLGFLYISKSGSANAQLPGCFCPWTSPHNCPMWSGLYCVLWYMDVAVVLIKGFTHITQSAINAGDDHSIVFYWQDYEQNIYIYCK